MIAHSKLVWVVERDGVMGSTNTDLLRSALDACGQKWLHVDPRYFSDDLPETNEDIGDNMWPIYYGSTTLRDKLTAHGKPGVFFDPHRFSFAALKEGYGENLLNGESVVMTIWSFLSDCAHQDQDELLFVRPSDDSKSLNGYVQTRREWVESIRISMNNTRGPKNDTQVQVAQPRNIETEWRLFVVGGKVAASSQYRYRGHLNAKADTPQRVVDYAERMAVIYQPASVFVMDVCEMSSDNSLRVVETNCFNCSGFYKADVREIIAAVNAHVMPGIDLLT